MTKTTSVGMDKSSYFGRHIKDYQIFDTLGKGSFGTVHRAKLKQTGHEVAVKIIDKQRMNEAGMLERVFREVEIHKGLEHPSILTLYDYFEDAAYVYLILELCHEGTLHSYMKRNGARFSEDEARRILQQVVEGFIYLQSKNIIHRDVKLENILLTKEKDIKIADFGLATRADENHKTMCGTPNYIAPEVATHCSQGLEVDVYSLGCLLYTILVGRPPFEDKMTRATITRSVMIEVDIPSNISPEAADLIKSLLKKNPKDRIKLRAVMNHPFLLKTNLRKTNSRLNLQQSIDSGLGSIGSSTLSSGISARRSRSDLDVKARSMDFDSSHHRYGINRNQWSYDTDIGYLSMHRTESRPVCGKSPPVRLEPDTRRKINLKPTFPALPSLGFSSNFTQKPSFPSNTLSSNLPVKTSSCHERDVSEERRKCQSIGISNNDQCDHMSEHSTCLAKSTSNDCQSRTAKCQCHSNSSQCSSCHGCSIDRNSCCNQCSESGNCGHEQHCPRNKTTCCTVSRENSRCRSPSPSHSCHRSNSKPSCCSHYGSCDSAHCVHGELCCCRKGTHNQGCSPAKEHCHVQHDADHVSPENHQECQQQVTIDTVVPPKSLKDFTPPLNTTRLMPLRQKANNAVVSILGNGEVAVEILKKHNNKEKVVDVCRISADGMRIITYRPDRHGVVVGNEPPPIPKNGADDIYGYESLPQKHWKKYIYAARFIKLVQSKTPKLTFYSTLAKSVLMENRTDFEMSFYGGGKVVKTAESTKIIGPCGKVYCVRTEDDVLNLKEDIIAMWEHFLFSEKHCCTLDETLEALQQNTGESFFPAYFGKRPSSSVIPLQQNSNKENVSSIMSVNNGPVISHLASYDGTIASNFSPESSNNQVLRNRTSQVLPEKKEILGKIRPKNASSGVMTESRQHSGSQSSRRKTSKPRVVKKTYIQGIGSASELSTHDVQIHLEDGSELTLTESSFIYFTDKHGKQERYNQESKLPYEVQTLLKNVVPAVIKQLAKAKELPAR